MPPITGIHPPKSLCSPRALICFYRKHERYSFTGKFTIWSFESIRDQAVGISGRQICVTQTPQITGANPLTKPGELSFWLGFLPLPEKQTSLTNDIIISQLQSYSRSKKFPSKCLAFLTHEICRQTLLTIISVKSTHSSTQVTFTQTLDSTVFFEILLRLAYIDIWDLDQGTKGMG